MEEVDVGVPIRGGDDEPTMKTCGRDDREATHEGVPSASRTRPGRLVGDADVDVVDAGLDARKIDRQWATQSRSVIE